MNIQVVHAAIFTVVYSMSRKYHQSITQLTENPWKKDIYKRFCFLFSLVTCVAFPVLTYTMLIF